MPTTASNLPEENPVNPGVPTPRQLNREAVLIVNAKARNGEEWFTKAKQCLEEAGITLREAHDLQDPKQLTVTVQQAVDQGVKLVIVGGGDGTLRGAASILANTDVTLGLLPLGTVNDFARNLGIEPTVEAACAAIASGRVEKIHIGQANDNYFLITASLGFSSLTQTTLSPQLKKVFGPFGYIIACLLAMRKARQLTICVNGPDGKERYSVMQAGVIKGHCWMGGKCLIPGVKLENSKLAFYAVPPQTGSGYLRLARDLMQGRFFQTPGLRTFSTSDITIETDTPQPLSIDGDLCGQTPVRLRIAPEALCVCVPADYTPPL